MTDQSLTLYLLHFDKPIGRCEHYLGISRADRLEARLKQHSQGRGAKLTCKAAQLHIGFTLARFWLGSSWDAERRMKLSGHLRGHCPLCRGELALTAERRHYEPPASPPEGTTWQTMCWEAHRRRSRPDQ